MSNLIGCHSRVTDKYHLVIMSVFVKDIEGIYALIHAPVVLLPDTVIDKVVIVVDFKVLEFTSGGRKQFFTHLNVSIHGSTVIEHQ